LSYQKGQFTQGHDTDIKAKMNKMNVQSVVVQKLATWHLQ